MSTHRRPRPGSVKASLAALFGGSRQRRRSLRPSARQPGHEVLEQRHLLALSVTSVAPLDGSTDVPLDSDLVFTFNENVIKGQGNIYVVPQATGVGLITVDVQSAAVTVVGNKVSVDLPSALQIDTKYSVAIDPGSFRDTSGTAASAAPLLKQTFDYLTLVPQVFETSGNGVNDWTPTAPLGFQNPFRTEMTGVGVPEWRGWTFARKEFWINADNQARDAFGLGSGTIAVADTDEYDDGLGAVRPFEASLLTKPVNLDGVAPNSVTFAFDSSFRPEDSQIGTLEASYDGGTTWTNLLTLTPSNTDNDAPFPRGNVNERLVTGSKTGGNVPIGAVANPSSGSLVFRFTVTGGNDWWWAADNLMITGDVVGLPYGGLEDLTAWDFRTPEAPKLTLSIDRLSMSENGGTAIGTVTRNSGLLVPSGEIVVSLLSSDVSEATVPPTVTIPAGQLSATFPITAVDDLLPDRGQVVTITASAPPFVTASATITVNDDEGPKIVAVTPPDDSTGVDYKSNFTIRFDQPVQKGTGLVHLVDVASGFAYVSIPVENPAIVVVGDTVTIDPPLNLRGLTGYAILLDDGAIRDVSPDLVPNSVLLTQSFDLVPLGPFPPGIRGSDGTDFSFTGPPGFSIDNTLMPAGGSSPFNGWSYMAKSAWIAEQGDQSRSRFSKGSGTVVVADPDAWDDYPHAAGRFNSFFVTPAIDLAGVTPGSVTLEFDSSYYPELPQFGVVEVSYNDGASWGPLLFFGDANNPNDGRNDHIVVSQASVPNSFVGGATVDAALSSPATGLLKFRFGLLEGENNWWWAVDNVVIRGERAGQSFGGIADPTAWNVTTAAAPEVIVSVTPATITEKGTATGTVTRSPAAGTTGDLVVTLTSSNPSAATVPGTVTIPDGATSATFVITAVDDTVADGTQTTTIDAAALDHFSVPAVITVLDDDFPQVVLASPLPGATGVPVTTNGTITFNQPVRKGNGFVYLIDMATGKAVQSIDVNAAAVSIAGAVVTIDPPADLQGSTTFGVRIDPGAFLSELATPSTGVTLLTQDFELVPLRPAILETVGLTPNGQDFSPNPPAGWSTDNSQMPPGGAPEWYGWTLAAKSFWQTQGGQSRANFTRGTGTIAVADTDEWDDYPRPSNAFNARLTSTPIDLATVAPGSVVLAFDSSFRPESGGSFVPYAPDNMQGKLDVSYDGGLSWTNLLTLDSSNTLGTATAPNVNERRVVTVPNPDTGTMLFRWGNTGTNDWWWAIDNILVTGTVDGLPYPGTTDPAAFTFTTAAAPTLAIGALATAAENGGVVTATVSRTLGTTGVLVVALTSDDPGVTVPGQVTIPDGELSATFPITVIDNSVFDGDRRVVIGAAAAGLVSGTVSLLVADNESGALKITEIMYDPAGAEPATEWVEIVNTGTTIADLSGWFLDDEDTTNFGPIAAGVTLAPGEVAVLYNTFFGTITDTIFRDSWQVPAAAKLVGVSWGDLANSPTNVAPPGASNEVLVLRDRAATDRNTVDFAEDGTIWPAYSNGSSLYLQDLTADNAVGTNWRSARVGVDGGIRPTGSVFSPSDIGSPGWTARNANPLLAVANATVAGSIGGTITNSGTWSDADGDTVTLSASSGTVTNNGDGTWSWSLPSAAETTGTTVTISATDGRRGVASVSFNYTATNAAPALGVGASSVTGDVLQTLVNTGTWSDAAADTVTLSASLGTVTKNGDGTWSWSLTPSTKLTAETVTITGIDQLGASSSVTFTVTAKVAVPNQQIYHKGSSFAGTSVDAALDPGKVLARPGAAPLTLTYANLINSSRGLNGIVIDVAGLVDTTLSAADFSFKMSPQGAFDEAANPPSAWAAAPVPTAIVVTPGTATIPARVRLEWPDNAIANRWLQVAVLANARTGLDAAAVSYVGHLQGEVNGQVSNGRFRVTAADVTPVGAQIGATVTVGSAFDIVMSGRITTADLTAVSSKIGGELRVITIPVAGSASHGTFFGSGGNGDPGRQAAAPRDLDLGAVALEITARDLAFAEVGIGSTRKRTQR
ncbi:MAG: Ig-like domain-containing protein [Planctomycetes bacterium]|nr:Ig-like domain-containing protein [Planctomycetota bacterium]